MLGARSFQLHRPIARTSTALNLLFKPYLSRLHRMATALPTPDPPEPEVYSDRWELIWSAGLSPGQRWDASGASPALVDLLASGKVDVKGKHVLVPGCGRGYDLPVFRSAGASEVVGLELSQTAAREAQEYLAGLTRPSDAGQEAHDGQPEAIRVEVGDFFVWTSTQQGNGTWDIGFDYTFGCAMQPSARREWAAHWGRHVRSGGLLVSLVFPVKPEADPDVGPPFPVSPQLYRELLEPEGYECFYEAAVPAERSHTGRDGHEVMMIWRKT